MDNMQKVIEHYWEVVRDRDIRMQPFEEKVKAARAMVEEMVREQGEYKEGDYQAYFQVRRSYDFPPKLLRQNLPAAMAAICIQEAVNQKALEGLLKGKLVTQEEYDACKVETKAINVFVCPVPKKKGGE